MSDRGGGYERMPGIIDECACEKDGEGHEDEGQDEEDVTGSTCRVRGTIQRCCSV